MLLSEDQFLFVNLLMLVCVIMAMASKLATFKPDNGFVSITFAIFMLMMAICAYLGYSIKPDPEYLLLVGIAVFGIAYEALFPYVPPIKKEDKKKE
jgi:hypothetical protein